MKFHKFSRGKKTNIFENQGTVIYYKVPQNQSVHTLMPGLKLDASSDQDNSSCY